MHGPTCFVQLSKELTKFRPISAEKVDTDEPGLRIGLSPRCKPREIYVFTVERSRPHDSPERTMTIATTQKHSFVIPTLQSNTPDPAYALSVARSIYLKMIVVRTRVLRTHSAIRAPFESPPGSPQVRLPPCLLIQLLYCLQLQAKHRKCSLPEQSEARSFSHLFVQTPLSFVPSRVGGTDPRRS